MLIGLPTAGVLLVVVATAATPQRVSASVRAPAIDPCSSATLRLRCPDLVISPPANLEKDRVTHPGHVLLRASSSVDNHGAGPVELVGHRIGPVMNVTQVIYDSRGRRHFYPTRARLVFKRVPGSRYGRSSVSNVSYWKLHHAAAFSLWTVNRKLKAQAQVRVGPKLDYCLRDLVRTAPSRRSPSQAVYQACRTDRGLTRDVLGTSVGWSDVYPYEYPEQWIDVTGLKGRFAYVQTADPLHLLHESNSNNNISETILELPSGRVLGHRSLLAHA